MTNENNPETPPRRLSILERLKSRRKMLGISKQKMAEDLGISVKEIKHYENQSPQNIETYDKIKIEGNEPKKYIIEIYEEGKRPKGRELYFFDFKGKNLLFEEITNPDDYIEFSARIKQSGERLYDEFDNIYFPDPDNILEIINIRKVEKNV